MTTSTADAAARPEPAETSQADEPARRSWPDRWTMGAIVVTLVGLAHALVVSIRYHVGSFDDDASYVSLARAIAAG
ncbi:MAG: hypothetical protein ACRDZ8_13870, partial [Acidimicrobiales bacterium]